MEAGPGARGDRCFKLIMRCYYPAIFSIILDLLDNFLGLLPARTDLAILSTYKKFIMKQGVLCGPSQGILHITRIFYSGFRPPLILLNNKDQVEIYNLPFAKGQIGISDGTGMHLQNL